MSSILDALRKSASGKDQESQGEQPQQGAAATPHAAAAHDAADDETRPEAEVGAQAGLDMLASGPLWMECRQV